MITYPTSTGETAGYGYDLDGNLTSNAYSGPAVGTQNQSWGYNADDLQSSTSQLGGFSSPYSYGVYDRLRIGTVPGYTSGDTYTYNPNGELASDAQPNGKTTNYTYNAADELTQMSSSSSPSGNISAVGSLASAFGTGVSTLSVSPQSAGDALVLAVQVDSSSISVSQVSGGGATWSKLTSVSDATQSRDVELWLGTISTTGSSTITVSFSGSVSGIGTELDGQEYTAGTGASTIWGKDKVGSSQNDTSSVVRQ